MMQQQEAGWSWRMHIQEINNAADLCLGIYNDSGPNALAFREFRKRERYFRTIEDGDLQVVVYLSRFLHIAFAGTRPESVSSVWRNVQTRKVDTVFGGIHEGFYSAAVDLLPEIRVTAAEIFEGLDYERPERWLEHSPVVFSGHSQGGAVAAVVLYKLLADSLEIGGQNSPQWNLVTFGAPRHGDKRHASIAEFLRDAKNVHCRRFTRVNDPVPRLPVLGYRHSEPEFYFGRQRMKKDPWPWVRPWEGLADRFARRDLFRAIESHSMEAYRRDVQEKL